MARTNSSTRNYVYSLLKVDKCPYKVLLIINYNLITLPSCKQALTLLYALYMEGEMLTILTRCFSPDTTLSTL